MEIETKELVALKGQASKLGNRANAVGIETQEDYAAAIDFVTELKDFGSKVKNKKESITKPLNEALRNVRELFAPIERQFDEAEQVLKTKILIYKRKKDEEAKAQEAKIAQRVEKGTLKLETAERKIEDIERVENTTRGNVGEVQIRKVKKVRIVNGALIPREYLIPDIVAIRRDALGGKTIEGVEVYEEEVVAAGGL